MADKIEAILTGGVSLSPRDLMDTTKALNNLKSAISSHAKPIEIKKAYDILYGLAVQHDLIDNIATSSDGQGTSSDEF